MSTKKARGGKSQRSSSLSHPQPSRTRIGTRLSTSRSHNYASTNLSSSGLRPRVSKSSTGPFKSTKLQSSLNQKSTSTKNKSSIFLGSGLSPKSKKKSVSASDLQRYNQDLTEEEDSLNALDERELFLLSQAESRRAEEAQMIALLEQIEKRKEDARLADKEIEDDSDEEEIEEIEIIEIDEEEEEEASNVRRRNSSTSSSSTIITSTSTSTSKTTISNPIRDQASLFIPGQLDQEDEGESNKALSKSRVNSSKTIWGSLFTPPTTTTSTTTISSTVPPLLITEDGIKSKKSTKRVSLRKKIQSKANGMAKGKNKFIKRFRKEKSKASGGGAENGIAIMDFSTIVANRQRMVKHKQKTFTSPRETDPTRTQDWYANLEYDYVILFKNEEEDTRSWFVKKMPTFILGFLNLMLCGLFDWRASKKKRRVVLRKSITNALRRANLIVRKVKSKDGKTFLVKITADRPRLDTEAENLKMKKKLKNGRYEVFSRPQASLFEKYDQDLLFYTPGERLFLVHHIIVAPRSEGGANIDVNGRNKDNSIHKLFPLHSVRKKKALKASWLPHRGLKMYRYLRSPFDQPLDDIRDYYGEKVAFYFAFLAFYSKWLVAPSLIGFLFFIYQLTTLQYNGDGVLTMEVDTPYSPFYSLFIALWASFFLEFWQRKKNELAHRWNTAQLEDEEVTRPEFKGQVRVSQITGELELFEPKQYRVMRQVVSSIVSGALICGLIFIMFVFFFWEDNQSSQVEDDITRGLVAATVYGLIIPLFNGIYRSIAHLLNNWENYKTNREHSNAFILKIICFQFVNSYFSLFWIAYSNISLIDDPPTGVMERLLTQLASFLITGQIVGNIREVWLPIIVKKFKLAWAKKRKKIAEEDGLTTSIWKEQRLPEFNLVTEYVKICIQFGYIALFNVAFPLAPLLALVNNILEVRTDSFKILMNTKRPHYERANGIGAWEKVFRVFSYMSVINNLGIIGYGSSILHDALKESSSYSPSTKVVLLLGIEHVILMVKFGFHYIIDDVPKEVNNERKRDQWEYSKYRAALLRRKVKAQRETELAESVNAARKKSSTKIAEANENESDSEYEVESDEDDVVDDKKDGEETEESKVEKQCVESKPPVRPKRAWNYVERSSLKIVIEGDDEEIGDGDDESIEETGKKEAEEQANREVEEKAMKEAEEKAKREAEEKAKREAEEQANREAEEQAMKEAEEQAMKEAEEQANREAEEKAKREAEEKAKREAEEKAKREAEEKAMKEAEEQANREAEEKAKREAEEQANREAEEKAKREAEEKAKREAEEKTKTEAEEKAMKEAEEKAMKEAEEQANREAEEKAKREAEEQANREAEEKAMKEADEKAMKEAEEKARREAEEKAKKEAEEQAMKEAEEKAIREAEEQANREAEEKARKEAEEQAMKEAEEKAKREAEEQAMKEAEEQAKREAEEQAKREAECKTETEEEKSIPTKVPTFFKKKKKR